MKLDITPEIVFKTARSGGKGGQHVNKVETQVEGSFHIQKSRILTENQKELILSKLYGKCNSEGFLQIKSRVHRSQLGNKEEVIRKFAVLLEKALVPEKKRKATKPGKASREKRLESKKITARQKEKRKKIRFNEK